MDEDNFSRVYSLEYCSSIKSNAEKKKDEIEQVHKILFQQDEIQKKGTSAREEIKPNGLDEFEELEELKEELKETAEPYEHNDLNDINVLFEVTAYAYYQMLKLFELEENEVILNSVIISKVLENVVQDSHHLRKKHCIKSLGSDKYCGFLTFWITKLRPIQVINDLHNNNNNNNNNVSFYPYANEFFAMVLCLGRLNATLQSIGETLTHIELDKLRMDRLIHLLQNESTNPLALAYIYQLILDNSKLKYKCKSLNIGI